MALETADSSDSLRPRRARRYLTSCLRASSSDSGGRADSEDELDGANGCGEANADAEGGFELDGVDPETAPGLEGAPKKKALAVDEGDAIGFCAAGALKEKDDPLEPNPEKPLNLGGGAF